MFRQKYRTVRENIVSILKPFKNAKIIFTRFHTLPLISNSIEEAKSIPGLQCDWKD
jgi:hypothetical protein